MRNSGIAHRLPSHLIKTLVIAALACPQARAQSAQKMELTRPARPWEFLDAVGQKAAFFGNEAGQMEGWVYPLKLFKDMQLRFHTQGQINDNLAPRILDAKDCVRQVFVRPESATVEFATDTFTVRETFIVPPTEPGMVIRIDTDTFAPMQLEVQFTRDFQLMWPAAIGATFMEWDGRANAFVLSHEARKFAGVIGSPDTVAHQTEYFTNYGTSDLSSLLLKPIAKGHSTQYVYVAGAMTDPADALANYARISGTGATAEDAGRKYYADYLARTVQLQLPDEQLQTAYDWSRISTVQGLVDNPFLGRGLIAGYRTSGGSGRPGFAWFFGRDSLWSDLALDSIGDFQTTKTALEFIAKFQRADGKVEHEISQSATLVDWFKQFPYAYVSADATPLFILSSEDYVTRSGDVGYVNAHWDNLWRAYQFLKSTYDPAGLPRNFGVGHGWIEGGPLVPINTELYQAALGAAALDSLSKLAKMAGKQDIAVQLQTEFAAHRQTVNNLFWSPQLNAFAFALDRNDKRVDYPTALGEAPMWWGVFDQQKADGTIDAIHNSAAVTDWGMRPVSNKLPIYGPAGYHFGAVWPLFTGWAAQGEYRYHHPMSGWSNLRANAQLTTAGPLGRVQEVMSGTYFEAVSTSSPHQIWSSAMVLSPLMRGLLGISNSVPDKTLTVAPHTPAGWTTWSANNVPACGGTVDLKFERMATELLLRAEPHGLQSCTLIFSPSLSVHAHVHGGVKTEVFAQDQHATVSVPLDGKAVNARVMVTGDFGLDAPGDLPTLGGQSKNLIVSREQWSIDRHQVKFRVEGIAGMSYRLKAYGAKLGEVNGGKLMSGAEGQIIEVSFPASAAGGYVAQELTLTLGG